MKRKWKKLWAEALTAVLISLFCAVVGLGLVYVVCGLFSLLYKVLIGG